MKLFARMMRVVGVGLALSAVLVAPASASPRDPETVPFGWPVVADSDTSPQTELGQAPLTSRGALIKLSPIGSASPSPGVQTVVAPRGYAIVHPENNFLVDPVSVVQREDQLYDVADASGSVVEVDLVTGKQTLIWSGAPLVAPKAIVIDPLTQDLLVLDSGLGGGAGGIFRLHEGVSGAVDTPVLVHDGTYGPTTGTTTWPHMVSPRGMDVDAQGNLYIADAQASPNFYTNGALFKVNPNAPDDVNNPATTPRTPVSWDAHGAPDYAGEYFLDPQGVIVRPDGIYVVDSKDNKLDSNAGVIRVDPTTGVQTFVAGGFSVAPPAFNFFAGGLFGIAPVDPAWAPTPPNNTRSDDVYVLDANYVDPGDGTTSGMVGVVNPTNPDPTTNQVAFGSGYPSQPFSYNHTFNNVFAAFSDPHWLVTSRDLPNPPVFSVNTGAGDAGPGGAIIQEPAGCGAEGTPVCTIKFKIRLDHDWPRSVKVDYQITDVTATTAVDYINETAAGKLTATFLPGDTVQTVSVPVRADLLDEPDETMKITLSSPFRGTLDPAEARRTAIGTILDDDPQPTVTATSPPPTPEANVNVACHLHLDAPSGRPITINWASADGTAVQPGDYGAVSSGVTFAPGEVDKDLGVQIKDDTLNEDTENFTFNLTQPGSFVTIPAGTKCTADITDNDPVPKLTIKDTKSNEGNSGTRDVTLTVALSSVSGKKVSVKWATADDVATLANKDYVQASGTLDFAPGEATKSIVVKIVGDTVKEQDEPFKVVLSNPSNATILTGSAAVTIVNDDEDPTTTTTPSTPGGATKPTTSSGGTKACSSRRTFHIRVKATKLRKAKVVSAKIFVNSKLVTTRKGKRLTAPVVLKGLKKGRYKVVIKAKLSDGRTVTDIRRYYTCHKKIVK